MSVMSLVCAAVVVTGLVATNATTPRVRMTPRNVVPEATVVSAVVAQDNPVVEVDSVSVTLVPMFPAETNLPVKAQVPETIARMLASATAVQLPEVIAKTLAETSSANLPNVLSAVYAKILQTVVPETKPADLIKIRLEWYEKFVAVPSSKAWWILKIAQEKAEKGESVENLRLIFEECMKNWLAEESDE